MRIYQTTQLMIVGQKLGGNMKKILILIPLLASCQTYHANLGGASYHFKREYKGQKYNEKNLGIGAGGTNSYGNHNVGSDIQVLENSFGNDSVYLVGSYTYTNIRTKNLTNSTGFIAGGANGYGNRFGRKAQDIIPVAGVYNEGCWQNYCLYQVVMPPFQNMSGFAGLGSKYKF
jgi:hypothetical protein